MPRVELITEKSQIGEDRQHEYDEIVGVLGRVGGPFGVLMYSPGLAEMVCKTGAHVRLKSELTMEEREWAVDYDRPQSATEAYKKLREG